MKWGYSKGLENKDILKIKRVLKNAQSHYNESYYLTNKGISNIMVHWALLYADVEKQHIIIIDSLNYNYE